MTFDHSTFTLTSDQRRKHLESFPSVAGPGASLAVGFALLVAAGALLLGGGVLLGVLLRVVG